MEIFRKLIGGSSETKKRVEDPDAQRKLVAEYLTGKINLDEFKIQIDKVTIPIDLVKLAAELKR